MKKKILFVCLGNICRSSTAEGVMLHLIKENRQVWNNSTEKSRIGLVV